MAPISFVVFLSIASCLMLLARPVSSDSTLEDWSCSPDTKDVSSSYHQKVLDVLHAMEVDILTYSSWDLLYRTTGDTGEEVVGSGGCIPSKDIKNMDGCYSCILSAREQLLRLCPNNVRGSVFLKSCTLMFARPEERTSNSDPDRMEWEEKTIDDELDFVEKADM